MKRIKKSSFKSYPKEMQGVAKSLESLRSYVTKIELFNESSKTSVYEDAKQVLQEIYENINTCNKILEQRRDKK